MNIYKVNDNLNNLRLELSQEISNTKKDPFFLKKANDLIDKIIIFVDNYINSVDSSTYIEKEKELDKKELYSIIDNFESENLSEIENMIKR